MKKLLGSFLVIIALTPLSVTELNSGFTIQAGYNEDFCNLPTPTTIATTSPSVTYTPTFLPTYIPTPTAVASQTPFTSPTPIATIFDVCQNIDGIQTSVPDGKHLDAGNINCVEFSPSGPSESNNTPSTVITNVQTQVLGTSTMAATGAFEESLFYSIFTLGTLLTSFGIMKNGKKKAFGFN